MTTDFYPVKKTVNKHSPPARPDEPGRTGIMQSGWNILKYNFKLRDKMKNLKAKFFTILAVAFVLAACNQSSQQETKNATGDSTAVAPKKVERYGMVTGLKEEKVAEYKKLHAAVWPGVLKKITECNIRNYSIYLKEIDGKPYLFSYWEYTGSDFDADMKKMAGDTTTQRWWKETAPLQVPLADAAKGETWSRMEEVFHEN